MSAAEAAVAEAKYSADQLRDMLAKGHAIRNDNGEPSYPIADEDDLRKAIQAVGRGGGSHNKIRAYIVRRAKALGKSDLIPDNWGSSGQMKETVTESMPLVEAVRGEPTGKRMRIKLISAGWGSSGHYSESVLRRAAADRIYPAGTQMFLDHPGASESADRPERSLRDLAAVLTGDSEYDNGALWNVAEVFTPYQQVLNEMKDHIGVSIRAAGVAEYGEAEGREGTIITQLTEGISVDFVTKAGRGGQIVEVLEAARAANEPGEPGEDPAPAAETHTPAPPAQLLEEHRMSGVTQPGTPPSGGAQATDVSEAAAMRTELAEARTELAETRQRLAEAELTIAKHGDNERELAETRTELEESKRENLRLRANNAARDKATETLAESTLPKVAHAKVIDAVTGDNVPLNDEGSLDEAALVKNIRAAIQDQRDYLTAFAAESGMGQVTGLGGSDQPQVDVKSELGDVFKTLGMSENAASVAAHGRG